MSDKLQIVAVVQKKTAIELKRQAEAYRTVLRNSTRAGNREADLNDCFHAGPRVDLDCSP